ncbi:MAG: threonine synthase [Candidatus Izemoplasmatales bacterium]|jgi:threonine synthase|nr:threonine synthase [Candidatus Izemoplasmatales bacterium]
MNFVKNYQCTLCHKVFEARADLLTCPLCGEKGVLEINYDYDKMKKIVSPTYFQNNSDYTMWRYLPMMSVEDTKLLPTLKIGWTPLYNTPHLGDILGIKNLYVKDEGLNPTASLKDRASGVAVIKAMEIGQKVIACASTGNAASSLAGNAARMGLKSVIFVPKRAPLGKLAQLMVFGATVISVDGDYKDAFNLSKAAIDHYHWYNRNAAINPHLVEGKKTVALEIAEQMHFQVPDWVAVSVGDGCTIAGVYKGFFDFYQLGMIDKIPKILGIQSTGCAPFVEAFKQKRYLQEVAENTIADSISVGIPRNPQKAINAVSKSQGTWIAVSDEAILAAMKLLGKTEGIFGEPAGTASVAGVKQAIQDGIIKSTDTVVIIMTGNGLKDPANAVKAAGSPIIMKPNLQEFIQYMEKKDKEVSI